MLDFFNFLKCDLTKRGVGVNEIERPTNGQLEAGQRP